jgi:hypothetical protein
VPYAAYFASHDYRKNFGPESREWYETLRQRLTQAAARLNNDPWCIGLFVDNELKTQGRDIAWWETYYRRVSELAKHILPNKLYLGSRLDFHDFPDSAAERIEIARIAAKYTDVARSPPPVVATGRITRSAFWMFAISPIRKRLPPAATSAIAYTTSGCRPPAN